MKEVLQIVNWNAVGVPEISFFHRLRDNLDAIQPS